MSSRGAARFPSTYYISAAGPEDASMASWWPFRYRDKLAPLRRCMPYLRPVSCTLFLRDASATNYIASLWCSFLKREGRKPRQLFQFFHPMTLKQTIILPVFLSDPNRSRHIHHHYRPTELLIWIEISDESIHFHNTSPIKGTSHITRHRFQNVRAFRAILKHIKIH